MNCYSTIGLLAPTYFCVVRTLPYYWQSLLQKIQRVGMPLIMPLKGMKAEILLYCKMGQMFASFYVLYTKKGVTADL